MNYEYELECSLTLCLEKILGKTMLAMAMAKPYKHFYQKNNCISMKNIKNKPEYPEDQSPRHSKLLIFCEPIRSKEGEDLLIQIYLPIYSPTN